MSTLDRQFICEFGALQNRFGRPAASQKLALVKGGSTRRLSPPRAVVHYHNILLHIIAHPDNQIVLNAAQLELQRIAATSASLTGSKATVAYLAKSGLPGTQLRCGLAIEILEWLLHAAPGDIQIAWEKGSAGSSLDATLASLLPKCERDILHCDRFTTERLVQTLAAARPSRDNEIRWLLDRIYAFASSFDELDLLWDWLDLRLSWTLNRLELTPTYCRFPDRPIFFRKSDRRPTGDVRMIRRALPAAQYLRYAAATELIEVARAALTVRLRETDPITFANPAEVSLHRVDRGIDVALFGMSPAHRLPLESYIGFVAARNRVPIAYGGAWVFGHCGEIGVHVFDTFRGGESSHLFAQVMRVYHHCFDLRSFTVDPYQFGADNSEAIRAGAYWFYYRLGFRSECESLRKLAETEADRIRANPTYRSPRSVLRRFTKARLRLTIAPVLKLPDPSLVAVGISAHIRKQFDGDRSAALRWARRRAGKLLLHPSSTEWPAPERASFDMLIPLIAFMPGIDQWTQQDRRRIVSLMRAKGGSREAGYIRHVQSQVPFGRSLREFVESIDWAGLPAKKPRTNAASGSSI